MAQKQQKDLKSVKVFSSTAPKKNPQKLNRIGAPEGTLLDFSSILSKIVNKIGGALLVKKNLKKMSQCRKKKVMSEL